MYRIPATNDGALAGNRDTVAGPMAGMPQGRFGDRRVSEAPEGPHPPLRTRRTDAAQSTPPDRHGGQWPAGVTVGSVADTPGTSSSASAAVSVGERPGTLSEPSPRPAYRWIWNAFVRWCNQRNVPYLPASPETVANYLAELGKRCAVSTLRTHQTGISRTLVAAGCEDRYRTGVVQSTLEELAAIKGGIRCRSKRVSGSSLDAADLESIRARALEPRPRGGGFEHPEKATHRGQVDRALCSLALEAGLQCEQVAKLEWQELGIDEDGGPAITVRTGSAGAGEVISISEQAYDDLDAIAPEDAKASRRIFPLDAEQVADRIRAAARAAGLESRIAVPRSRQDADGATANAPSAKARAYDTYWREFRRWCEKRGEDGLPARPETVAEYLRGKSKTRGMHTIRGIRYAIRNAHHVAGHGDPCNTGPVKAVNEDLRRGDMAYAPISLDSESLEAIRAAATILRQSRRTRKAQLRTQVNVALCSVLLVGQLTARQAVDLKWRDVENLGADKARLTLRSAADPHDGAEIREIAGEVVRELKAMRGDARPEESVFGIKYDEVYYRVRKAARIARLRVSTEAGPSHTATAGPSHTVTAGPSHTVTAGPSHTATAGPSHTATAGPSHTATAGPSHTVTASPPRISE